MLNFHEGNNRLLITKKINKLFIYWNVLKNIAKKRLHDADSFDVCQPSLSNLKIVKGVRSLKSASKGVDYCDERPKSLCRRRRPPPPPGLGLIHMLSLIHLLNLSLCCSAISLASQFIIWLFWQTWSVMADLWCSLVEALRVDLVKFLSEIFSASFLCSVILVLSCLPVSPMYTFSHWLHGILYTTSGPSSLFLLINFVLRVN